MFAVQALPGICQSAYLDIPRSRKYTRLQIFEMLHFRATFLVSHFMHNMCQGGDGANTILRLPSNGPVMHVLKIIIVRKTPSPDSPTQCFLGRVAQVTKQTRSSHIYVYIYIYIYI